MRTSGLLLLSSLCMFLTCAGTTQAKPTADEAFRILREGNRRFMHQVARHPNARLDRVRLAADADQADYAFATILSCSDSRVPPEYLFDTGIMDLFVVRVAGNVADTDEIGSLEYGLCHVKTPLLVVLGHSRCGAVTAVAATYAGKGHALERHIPPLVDNILPAVERAHANHPRPEEIVPIAIEENVWQSVSDILKESAAIRQLYIGGRIKIVGAIYDLSIGEVRWLPFTRVAAIAKMVEAMPDKAVQPMADAPDHESQRENDSPSGKLVEPDTHH